MSNRLRWGIAWGFTILCLCLSFWWPWASNGWHVLFVPAVNLTFQLGLLVLDHYLTKYRSYLHAETFNG